MSGSEAERRPGRSAVRERRATATAHRRRLTLAPCATGMRGSRDPNEAKVWDASFADSGGSGEEDGREVGGKSYFQVDPLSGMRRLGGSSRFWPLTEELSSDEDEPCEAVSGSVADPCPVDASLMEVLFECGDNAKPLVPANAKYYASDGGEGRSLEVKRRLGLRPWKGPLPKRRSLQSISLGDLPVLDRRACSDRFNWKSLNAALDAEGRPNQVVVTVPEARKKEAPVSPDLVGQDDFKFSEGERSNGGLVFWAGASGYVRVGAQGLFRRSNAIDILLRGGGKPKGLCPCPSFAVVLHRSHSNPYPVEEGRREEGDNEMKQTAGGGFGGAMARGSREFQGAPRGSGRGGGGSDGRLQGRREGFRGDGFECGHANPRSNLGVFANRARTDFRGGRGFRGFKPREVLRQGKEWNSKQEQERSDGGKVWKERMAVEEEQQGGGEDVNMEEAGKDRGRR